jgi:hypothetical protein
MVNISGMVDVKDEVDQDEEDELHSIVLCCDCQRKIKMVAVSRHFLDDRPSPPFFSEV